MALGREAGLGRQHTTQFGGKLILIVELYFLPLIRAGGTLTRSDFPASVPRRCLVKNEHAGFHRWGRILGI